MDTFDKIFFSCVAIIIVFIVVLFIYLFYMLCTGQYVSGAPDTTTTLLPIMAGKSVVLIPISH
jgi:hypothetical protein